MAEVHGGVSRAPPDGRHLPRQPGRAAARGRLHPHRLVQALVLLHVPRHRPRAARHRIGRHLRRRCASGSAEPRTDAIIAVCSIFGADQHRRRLPRDLADPDRHAVDLGLRHQGARSRTSRSSALICFAIFASFIALGIIVSTILGRGAGRRLGRLYFADLIGAGLGCLAAIPLIRRLGPPEVIMLSALIFAVVGARRIAAPRRRAAWASARGRRRARPARRRASVALPDVRTEDTQGRAGATRRTPTGARCSASTSCVLVARAARRCAAPARRHVRLGDAQVRRRPGER